jgi:hypothetical protein
MRPLVFGLLVLELLGGTNVFAATSVRKSTPEATLARFVEGYRRADEEMVLSTLDESAGGVEPMTSGREEKYQILEKLMVISSSDPTSKAGDIHLRVRRQIKFATDYVEMIAYFRLRKIGQQWKIVGYAAY